MPAAECERGIRSCQLLLAILGAAESQGSRIAIARELLLYLRRCGDYAEVVEELTPIAGDPIAAVPIVAATLATIIWPSLWRAFQAQAGAVGAYSLTPEAWREILREVASGKDAGVAL